MCTKIFLYGWSNKPPPLARKMPSRLFYYRWASLPRKRVPLQKRFFSPGVARVPLDDVSFVELCSIFKEETLDPTLAWPGAAQVRGRDSHGGRL